MADFDHVGGLDIGVSSNQTGTVSVLVGHGDGTFADPQPFPTSGGNAQIVAADLDGDGFPDIAVISDYFFILQVLLSGGHPGLRTPPTAPVNFPEVIIGLSLSRVILADFTEDSVPDAIVSNPESQSLSINRGVGDGTFAALPNLHVGSRVTDMASADLDGDGQTDLLLATEGGIVALLSNGDGTFVQEPPFGSLTGSLAIGDFDHDGKPDVALARYTSNEIDVHLGNGNGTFGGAVSFARSKPLAIAAADFNADNFSDLAILSPDNDAVWIAQGGSGGALALSWTFGNLVGLQALAVGDLNDDGKPDVVVTYDSGKHIAAFLGKGDGSFSSAVTSAGTVATRMEIADVNGDGLGDLIVGGATFVIIRIGSGDGSFAEPVGYASTYLSPFDVTDLDDDGKADIVVATGSSQGVLQTFRNSRCEVRRVGVIRQPASCDVPEEVFATQPIVEVLDDGQNVIACDTGTVTASIVPGTGSSGAALQGTTAVNAVAGVATFTDLGVDLPGRGYRLAFSHPLAGTARSRTLTQGLTTVLNGPSLVCETLAPTYRTGSTGYDRYLWKVDDVEVSHGAMPTLVGLAPGDHTLSVDVFQDGCTATDSRAISVDTAPAPPTIGVQSSAPPGAMGLLAGVQPHIGNSYHWNLIGGTITSGQGTPSITFTAGAAGTTMVLEASEIAFLGVCPSAEDRVLVQVDFTDVPASHPFHDAVDAITRAGISKGCGGGSFCPDATLTRDQMAIFLLKAEHGGDYVPPPLDFFGTGFSDVPPGAFADTFIRQLKEEQITKGCGVGLYCPHDPVSRAQMAIFLLRIEHGADYQPPDATGTVFLDVPADAFGARFIEQLAREGISGGCGGGNFCPDAVVSRAQMAAFLKRTLNLR